MTTLTICTYPTAADIHPCAHHGRMSVWELERGWIFPLSHLWWCLTTFPCQELLVCLCAAASDCLPLPLYDISLGLWILLLYRYLFINSSVQWEECFSQQKKKSQKQEVELAECALAPLFPVKRAGGEPAPMLNFHVCSQSNLQLFFCEEHFDQNWTTNLHSKQILSSPGVTWVRWTVTTTMLAKRANLNQRQRSRGSNINFIIVPPKHRICLWNVLVFHLLLFSNAVCVLEPGHHLTGCVRPACERLRNQRL